MKMHAEAETRKGKKQAKLDGSRNIANNWCFLRPNVLSTSWCCNYFIRLCNNL